jgi:cyclic pyranopterin phosphate synthase
MESKKTNVLNFPDQEPAFRMMDVGRKRITRRWAIASGRITVGAAALARIKEKSLPKGNVLELAEVAGIMGAKKTPDLIPMCHTLPLDQVSIHCIPEPPGSVIVYCHVVAHAKTGVEMEAVSGVQAALATIWDLVKGVEPNLEIGEVRLLVKAGGKSGLWVNPDGIPDWLAEQLPETKPLYGLTGAIVVMSDRAFARQYEDKSGPAAMEILENAGAKISECRIVPDDVPEISSALKDIAGRGQTDFIITSGGTGFSRRDVTPEALEDVCNRMVPGFGELLRQDGAQITDLAWLSRSTAGLLGNTLIIALPGSPKAVKEGLEALIPVLPHALSMVRGGGH